jgi:hypothetical protein
MAIRWVTDKTFLDEGYSFQKYGQKFIVSYQGEYLGSISKTGKVDFMYKSRETAHSIKAKLILIANGMVKE